MTPVAWVLVALFATLAVSDWWATRAKRLHYRYFSKPATLLALIALASALQPADPGIRAVMVVGLALSLAGDVFLLFEERAFVAGLLSFLLAHIAYTVARQMAIRHGRGRLSGCSWWEGERWSLAGGSWRR